MSALILKIVACVTMLLDHIGYRLYTIPGLREIGRISFPIFAYMIASGASKTRNIYRYILRLLCFGVITEYVYDLYFFGKWTSDKFNVMFTLALALCGIVVLQKWKLPEKFRFVALLPTVFFGWLASFLGTDYGAWGVWLIVLLYLFDKKDTFSRVMTALSVAAFSARFVILYLLRLCASLAAPLLPFLGEISVTPPSGWQLTQMYAAASLIFILGYNGKRGVEIRSKFWRKVYQYGFYAFYPVHVFILWLIFK